MELNEKFINIQLASDIFKDIKYYITGEVHDKIESLLKSGGAERQKYLTDYVTHLIVGNNPEENDVADANDVYEIPAVTPKWILLCAYFKRRLNIEPYLFSTDFKLFTGQTFCLSQLKEDRDTLWGLITYHGGVVNLKLTSACTYLVTSSTEGLKYLKAYEESDIIKIVTPDWIMQAVKTKNLPNPALYHPKLITWPKPVKPAEPTTAITGFEPDIPDQTRSDEVPDSTQALLEKLKQRMPWNQPVSEPPIVSSSNDPVAPPNVVAPSFLSKMQQYKSQQQPPAANMNQGPRATVHHPPNSQIVNRIAQPQIVRPPGVQQLRGQVHPNQLMQARMQQEQQQHQQQHQMLQHTAGGQMTVNPQFVQHLNQGQQRQNLIPQNQMMMPQNIMQDNQEGMNQNFVQNQMEMVQRTQQERSPNQIITSPQHPQQGLMSPQQIMNHQQMQQQPQMQQQQPQVQQQQLLQQLNQQARANQLLNQNMTMQSQMMNQNHEEMQNNVLNQSSQHMMQQNQQPQFQQQPQQQPPNQEMLLQQPQMIQQNQQQIRINQQQLMNPTNQQQTALLSLPPNHHLSQLSPQQIQQLQQLKREQQQLLSNQQQNPQMVNQNHQMQMQTQQRVMQQQNFVNQQPNLNQQMIQKQQMFQQQQQQVSPPQFVNQNQFEVMQQQKLAQQQQLQQQQQQQPQMQQQQSNQVQMNQMNVQALNQQLQHQNLGQQLNQQLMQQNQQPPQQGLEQQGVNQGMGMMNQQQQQQQQQTVQRPPQQPQQMWPQGAQAPMQGQQIVRHNVAVQQSPTGAGPRVQWAPGQQPGMPQRQFIQLDIDTHNQLQKMPPDQRALFVAKLQKQRQLHLAKQRTGQIVIRGNVPQGLTTIQQVQWLQQQAKQQGIVLPPNIQPGNLTPQQAAPPAVVVGPQPHTPGLSPMNQPNQAQAQQQQFVGDQPNQQQIQLRQQFRLQQIQLQREQAQKNVLVQQQSGIPPQAIVRPPMGQSIAADSTTNLQVQVNPKTKTALANMLSNKLQSGNAIGPPARAESIPEQSAAGTLRMMTAQHNAAINSKPQEIMALHQRRAITGPGGEIIKPPGGPTATVPLPVPNDAPKMQYNQKPSVPVQHRLGVFYGHNPNLKLPPDLFLLGCIFVVVEVEGYLEEKLPGWQQKIEKYGGEVEKQYCSKVTHVLCETQRHGVVMQAIRDMKRCVTIRWLSDVIKRKQVLPPWTALHLPQIYLDITPASKHLISISGFEGNLRQIVKQMIVITGAKCTNYFSKHNTLLICSKADGKKFNYAKKWGIPVVNVQWLTDVILGNFTAMNQMDNQAYQTYSNPPNLSFDPKLVPNMMHAWKAPINISQESYERVKRSASPVSLPKPKKPKTEVIDENENITDEILDSNYKILLSQFSTEKQKDLEKIIKELGGIVAKDHKDFTHLVIPKLLRTTKLLFAIVKNCHILPVRWLEDSLAAKKFLPESLPDFRLPTEEFNQTYNVNYEKTIQSVYKSNLLEGRSFWITPTVTPSKKLLSELIELSGGKLERIRRSRAQIETTNATSPLSYFIITAKEDLHLVGDLLRNKKEKQRVVCNAELVLSALLRQEFEVEPHAVSVV